MAIQVFCRNYYFNSFSQWLRVFFFFFLKSLVGTLVKYRVKTESFLGNNEEGIMRSQVLQGLSKNIP